MAINLTALGNATNAAQALSNLILATPNVRGYQPQNKPNADGSPSTATPPPAILFNYEGEQTITLRSDITDHFIEDNTAIQDQIALHPVSITTHGFIGELNNVTPKVLEPLKVAADKLTIVNAYVPVISTTALIAYNLAVQAYQTALIAKNAGVAAWSGSALTSQTKQQQFYNLFYGYWKNRTLFTVQTPWAVYQNCAIEVLRAIQEADSNVISDFEVTFKQLQFTTTIVLGSLINASGRAGISASSVDDLGVGTTGPDLPFSVDGASA